MHQNILDNNLTIHGLTFMSEKCWHFARRGPQVCKPKLKLQCYLKKNNNLRKPQRSFLVTNKTFTHRTEKSNPVPLILLHFSSNINTFSCILLAVGAALTPLLKKNAVWEKVKFKIRISASC